MERRATYVQEFLPPMRLYLDDVVAICDVLRETCGRISIATPEYEGSEPAQLASLPMSVLRDLTITGFDPYISVNISSRNALLHVGTNDVTSLGVSQKLKEVLGRRKRRVARWFVGATGTGVSIVVLLIFYALLLGILISPHDRIRTAVVVALAVASLAVFLTNASVIWLVLRGANWIILANRREAPGFWERNRDALVVGGILAIVGAAVGSVLTYVSTRP